MRKDVVLLRAIAVSYAIEHRDQKTILLLSISTVFTAIVGWAGTLSYLAAYLLLSINKLKANKPLYHLLNIFGALGLTYNALVLKDYPNIIVDIAWAAIAGCAIFTIQQRKQN